MMTDTQHFVVSIDEGSSQGVYCAYCGEKIIPHKSESGAGFVFQCHCIDADHERSLFDAKSIAEENLEKFLIKKTDIMQINECQTRIRVYEDHTRLLKEKLQELENRSVKTDSTLFSPLLPINKESFPLDEALELSPQVDSEPESYHSFTGRTSQEDTNFPKN
jgi:hypothetical protein